MVAREKLVIAKELGYSIAAKERENYGSKTVANGTRGRV